MSGTPPLADFVAGYRERLHEQLVGLDMGAVEKLAGDLFACWKEDRQVFICGNGGSAANAIHMANDLIYGIAKPNGRGIRCHALPANSAVVTCLANDEGYDSVFATQLNVLARSGDLLIVLSGSGNSPNILKAIDTARTLGMTSYGLLGYSGGKAKTAVDVAVHFPIDDMQVSEDLQMIVIHMISQYFFALHRQGL